jgi:hypothetical protein
MSSVTDTIKSNDSAEPTRQFFDRYFTETVSYPSNQVDAVVGFFKKRGFDEAASLSVSTILLQQAKIDNVNVFQLLDTLKGLEKVQLNEIIVAILNVNRSSISQVGYKNPDAEDLFEKRNILV